jgi:hypothetical protein
VTDERDTGLVFVPMILSALIGALLAGTLSFTIVGLGTAKPTAPVNKPLITYDGN